jgi:cytochrome P450
MLMETQVLTKSFYELTQRPEYIEVLRSEVEQAMREHGGVGRESIEAMTKLDSFIKETMRLQPVGPGRFTAHSLPTTNHDFLTPSHSRGASSHEERLHL